MLSIGKLTPGRENYYLEVVSAGADEYYLHPSEIPGFWTGTLTDRLGLAGTVTGPEFRAVLAGYHPITGLPLIPGAGRPERTSGFDLTFSAPKSVSLLWALTDPDTATIVAAAHDAAVIDAVGFLEAEAVKARRGHEGGRRIDADGLVAAGFGHRSSRSGDPHLHTHVVAANLTVGADGRWSTPDSRTIYRWAKTVGYAYQAALRARLTETLGVQWQAVSKGVAEIDGISAAQRRVFSTRRAQIEAHLNDHDQVTASSARAATLITRPGKDRHEDLAQLRHAWTVTAEKAGLDIGAVPVRARRPASDRYLGERLVAPDGLTAQATSFDRRDLLQTIAAAHPDGAHPDTLRQIADRVVDRSDVVRLGDDRIGMGAFGGPRWSTIELLAVEHRLLAGATARRDAAVAIASPAVIRDVLEGRPELSDEQRTMVKALVDSGAGVQVVVGRAGTGKTFGLDAARAVWDANGNPVIGTALAAKAAAGLQAGAGIPSTTLDRLLADLDRPGPLGGLPHHAVIVVDEAGMVGTRKLDRLLTHAARADAKVVLVGDPRQLPEIDAGGTLAALTRTVPTVELVGNRRQVETWERAALDQLRSGSPAIAVAAYHDHGRITLAATADLARQALVADWWTARQDPANREVGMYALTRADVDDLNGRARHFLRTAGALTGADITIAGRHFAPGDHVLCLRNDHRLGAFNGMGGTLVHIDLDGAVVDRGDNRHLTLDHDYLAAGRLTHGYATTIHKAQGVTVDRAFILGTEHLYREAGYVAASRARTTTNLYTVAPTPTGREPSAQGRSGPLDQLTATLTDSRAQQLATHQHPDYLSQRRAFMTDPPAWAIDTIGPPPVTDRRGLDRWIDTAIEIDTYRHAHHITDTNDPLGPEPTLPAAHDAWRTAQLAVRLAQHQGLTPNRHRAHDLDQGLGL